MNLSCNDCAQCSSVRKSRTPPGADPALFTRISMRPSAVSASLTKASASAGLVRSAGIATILRRRCLERLLATRADRDIDTLASQGKGDRLANPGAPAGDECRLPVHLEIHKDSLRLNTAMRIYQGLPEVIACQSTA